MSTALVSLTNKLASRFDMGDGTELIATLKATAFKGQVSDAQMTALLIVANQYGLNPWTKEIYAFPDKNNGIVPVVGVDGWSRIINEHPQLDGIEFEYGPATEDGKHHKWIECLIYRKDRSRPIRAREFWSEVYRPNTGPWQSHGNRMHRHKSLIQCSRLAFGFAGIYDQDEAERIVQSVNDAQKSAAAYAERARVEGSNSEEAQSLIADLEVLAIDGDWPGLGKTWQSMSDAQKTMVGSVEFARLKELCKANMQNLESSDD
jgi:phage recombination protein Bet